MSTVEFDAVTMLPEITVINVTVFTLVLHLVSKVITLNTKTEKALLAALSK